MHINENEQKISELLLEFQKELDSNCVYRGQSDADWKVESGALRRLKLCDDSGNKKQHDVHQYTENIIDQAKKYTQEINENQSELEILAQLQHYGCATSLIDFSSNFLMALYFATEDDTKNGKVFYLDVSDPLKCKEVLQKRNKSEDSLKEIMDLSNPTKEDYKFGKWNPSLRNNRIIKQDSIFIFTKSGQMTEDNF